MSPLSAIIREKIAASGPISLSEYMGLALGHPEHGYYIKQSPFGARGDFITAPEISQIFGEMIGVWCVDLWRQMGNAPVSLVELGPGRGTLMADLLRATRSVPGFHDALSIHMVETSPALAHEQYVKLRNLHPRIEWLDHVGQLPSAPLLVIANEFFDALPIKQFEMTVGGVCERKVDWSEEKGEFVFTLQPAGLQLAKSSGSTIPPGTVMEQSPATRQVMRQLAHHIKTHHGAALIIDYGYLSEAHHDTLQAVKNHHFHPVLKDPGDADITAHVDFPSLGAIAISEGLVPFGPATQGDYLIRMGAAIRAEMLMKNATNEQKQMLQAGLDRLTSPQAMGELFKVLAVSSPQLEPPGFAL
jgi:NADH dehydrogenase [ubiquinone] 1 alpha subcomplex assembly factor 7